MPVVASVLRTVGRCPKIAASASSSRAYLNVKPSASAFAGTARWPDRSSASAISPSIRRSANAGAGMKAGRWSARPSARANSAFVTGFGAVAFSGPVTRLGLDRPPDEIDPVRAMNPRPVLAARSDRSADAEPERRQHLRQRAAVAFEHEPGSARRRRGSRTGRAIGFVFPLHAHPSRGNRGRAACLP